MSFADYLMTRKYHFGRGSDSGWAFVARALGDAQMPDAASWAELRAYLETSGDENSTIHAARVVWSSYIAFLTKRRQPKSVAPAVLPAETGRPSEARQ